MSLDTPNNLYARPKLGYIWDIWDWTLASTCWHCVLSILIGTTRRKLSSPELVTVSFFFSRHYNTTNPTLHIPLQAGEQLKRDNFRQLPLQAWGLPAWLLVAPAPAVHWPSQWAAAQAGAPKPCEARAQHQGFSSPACSRQHKLLPPHRWRAALSALALTFSSREAGGGQAASRRK